MSLIEQLSAVLNQACAENGSDTPDFILAVYLQQCLQAFDRAVRARDAWYGRNTPTPGGDGEVPVPPGWSGSPMPERG